MKELRGDVHDTTCYRAGICVARAIRSWHQDTAASPFLCFIGLLATIRTAALRNAAMHMG